LKEKKTFCYRNCQVGVSAGAAAGAAAGDAEHFESEM